MTAETESPDRARARARRPRPWWRGGSSVRAWRGDILGWSLLALGAGILLGAWIGGMTGTVLLWCALLVPLVLAFRRGVPRGLLLFRPVDVLYAVALAGVLRTVQGWLSVAFGGSGAFPSYPSVNGALPSLWWAGDIFGGAFIAPVVEEFFFRGVVLICVFTVVRRFAGGDGASLRIAGLVAVVTSTGLFVLTHQLVAPLSADTAVSLTLVGLTCSLLVVFTGRLWPALLLHILYNASGVLLTLAGTIIG